MVENIEFNAIAAICNDNNGIGINNKLPWKINEDYLYYLRVIKTIINKQKVNAVIYGRKTWEYLPKDEMIGEKCLKFILSKTKTKQEINPENNNMIILCHSWDEIFDLINNKYKNIIETLYVLGGAKVYEDAIKFKFFNKFYITRIFKHFDCDVVINPKNFLNINFSKIEDKNILKEKEKLFNIEYNVIKKDPLSGIEYIFEIYLNKNY